jgi:lysophospholipase L1-like esterase
MARTGRLIEYLVAAGLAAAAFVISPVGIKLFTGRADLSFRVNVISATCDLFLIAVIAAILARGRLRRACFYAVVWTFPFAALAFLEVIALSFRLADRIAPLEDTSTLGHGGAWPAYLMSDARLYNDADGLRLYRPWKGDGVSLNQLGLRTPPPTAKAPGEWRIAMTGGSAVWGWRVADADTIPERLQHALRRAGHANVTVYNFGIEGATLKQELKLLQHFRNTYAIDQVLFFTGANDVTAAYIAATSRRSGPWVGNAITFELIKIAARLQAMSSEPSPQLLQWLDNVALPTALKNNTLRASMLSADQYCRAVNLRCDFALQPMLYGRKTYSGPEIGLARTFARVYPRIDVLYKGTYREALAAGPAGHIFDLSNIFNATSEPFFIDQIHLNEAGNRIAAEHVLPMVSARLP